MFLQQRFSGVRNQVMDMGQQKHSSQSGPLSVSSLATLPGVHSVLASRGKH